MTLRYLRSKLVPPVLHTDSVVRHRLVDRLNGGNAGVWLLSAPAGYGKTTLVLQAIEAAGQPVAWLSIDSVDNDPVRFWTHLAATVLGEGDELEQLLQRLDVDKLDEVADDVVAAIEQRTEPLIVVLDDLHEIECGQTMEILGRIVSRLPAGLRVVITSRVDPALPIGRLRAHGALAELRAQDLAFTVEEAGAVFGALDLETVESIVDKTEGWATALRLLAVSLGGAAEPHQALDALNHDRGDIADFLSAEALGSLRPDLQQFLITTSIVDELCPELADRLTGHPGSLATLRELARSQLFTDLIDPASNTYRYHRLFREFLRNRAAALSPAALADLHQTAAAWYDRHESPTATVEHAMKAGNEPLALRTIKDYFGEYGQAGRMPTTQLWLDMYGAERCREDAQLRLIAAWVSLNVRNYDDVEQWLELPEAEVASAAYLAQSHAIRSHLARHRGQLGLAIEEADQAVAAVPDPDPDGLDWSFVHAARSIAVVIAGRPDLDTANEAVRLGQAAANYASMVTGYAGLAAAAMEGEASLETAEAFADQALSFVDSPALERFHQPVSALLVKSAAALARGQVGDAAGYAERADGIATQAVEPLLSIMVKCQLGRVSHAQGHSEEVRRRLREADALVSESQSPELAELVRQTRNDTRFAAGGEGLAVELSERELAVLHLLPHRLSRKELGAQLFVSENTVKTHLTSLRHKLGVTGRSSEIVSRAVELGLLPATTDG